MPVSRSRYSKIGCDVREGPKPVWSRLDERYGTCTPLTLVQEKGGKGKGGGCEKGKGKAGGGVKAGGKK